MTGRGLRALWRTAGLVSFALAAGCGTKPDGGGVMPTEKPRESCATEAERKLLLLESDRYLVGVLPDVGGRVVLFRRPGGANVLLTNPGQWDEPPEKRSRPSPAVEFVAYNGMIVWAGPQEEWWNHQDVNPQRRGGWPPDPWLVYGRYEVAERTPTSVALTGPASPVSGLSLTKEIRLEGDLVRFRFVGTNTRESPIAWDLWPNTRFRGDQLCYVPVASAESVRAEVDYGDAADLGDLPHEVTDGFFTYRVQDGVPEGKRELMMKAFIDPAEGAMATFAGGDCFVQRSERVPPDRIAPKQAFVEVWNQLNRGPDGGLLELELHGAYETLAPGGSMEMEMTWELHPYSGAPTPAAHVAFLKGLGIGR